MADLRVGGLARPRDGPTWLNTTTGHLRGICRAGVVGSRTVLQPAPETILPAIREGLAALPKGDVWAFREDSCDRRPIRA